MMHGYLADTVAARHTSGTTGLPKPIICPRETLAQALNAKSLGGPGGIPTTEGTLLNGKRILVTLPPFHLRKTKIPYPSIPAREVEAKNAFCARAPFSPNLWAVPFLTAML